MRPIIVLPGVLVRDRFGGILDASSTVTLIKTGDRGNILVDTGEAGREPDLLKGLTSAGGISPVDINVVVFTHGHGDHMGNNEHFLGAEFFFHPDEYIIKSNKAKGRVELSEGYMMASEPEVQVIETPGHTEGSITVIVKADSTYAIAGDALPTENNYREMVPPGINIDPDLALKSMERIIKIADYVIPGHDEMFKIDRN